MAYNKSDGSSQYNQKEHGGWYCTNPKKHHAHQPLEKPTPPPTQQEKAKKGLGNCSLIVLLYIAIIGIIAVMSDKILAQCDDGDPNDYEESIFDEFDGTDIDVENFDEKEIDSTFFDL